MNQSNICNANLLSTLWTKNSSHIVYPPIESTATLLSSVLLKSSHPTVCFLKCGNHIFTTHHRVSSQIKSFFNFTFEMQDKSNEECSSYTSSNRESWGRCSSLGSIDEPAADCTTSDDNHQVSLSLLYICVCVCILIYVYVSSYVYIWLNITDHMDEKT